MTLSTPGHEVHDDGHADAADLPHGDDPGDPQPAGLYETQGPQVPGKAGNQRAAVQSVLNPIHGYCDVQRNATATDYGARVMTRSSTPAAPHHAADPAMVDRLQASMHLTGRLLMGNACPLQADIQVIHADLLYFQEKMFAATQAQQVSDLLLQQLRAAHLL